MLLDQLTDYLSHHYLPLQLELVMNSQPKPSMNQGLENMIYLARRMEGRKPGSCAQIRRSLEHMNIQDVPDHIVYSIKKELIKMGLGAGISGAVIYGIYQALTR